LTEIFLDGRVTMHCGDNREVLANLDDASIDSIVTDPPYALVSIVKRFGKPGSAPAKGNEAYARASAGFMGKQWDTGEVAFDQTFWAECLRVLKPGGHVVAFSGTRTYHRMVVAIEDAGFEIRDQVGWAYGSGFPKSHDVSKGIDKAAGAEREVIGEGRAVKRMIPGADQNKGGWEKNSGREFVPTVTAPATSAAIEWQGWGTALKPAWEPVVLARKPIEGTVAANVLKYGTGAINVDGCRVLTDEVLNGGAHTGAERGRREQNQFSGGVLRSGIGPYVQPVGRWPANIVHDGSEEVLAAFPDAPGQQYATGPQYAPKSGTAVYGDYGPRPVLEPRADSGSAARFFYTAKADADDRIGSKHPTVKPVDLMQWLVRLVTPKGGIVLDPFAGTGTTAEAAFREGMRCILIERETEYQADIRRRMALVLAGPEERKRESIKAKHKDRPVDAGPLFSQEAT
jgi:site-specific DNA-methyltransferase (adenine-specific)